MDEGDTSGPGGLMISLKCSPAEAVLERSFPGLWSLPFFTVLLLALAVVFFKLPSLLS